MIKIAFIITFIVSNMINIEFNITCVAYYIRFF